MTVTSGTDATGIATTAEPGAAAIDPAPTPAEARSEEPELYDVPPATATARLVARLDAALATAETTVLWPVRRVHAWFVDVHDEARAAAPTTRPARPEPLYVAYLERPTAGPITALVVMMLAYIGVFGTLTYQQQSNYGTFGFDMGIYDHGIWLVSHFKNPFETIMGLQYFGHHVNLITLLFIPAYWLGAGPHFLYMVETVWLAAGAIPIWLLGRDRMQSSWTPLGLSAAYLLYPSVEWINWWHFHPDALIIAPLMFAYWLATRARWGWFWVAVAIALSCKEDAGLAVFALGLCIWLKLRHRAMGLLTSAAGAGWFLFCTKLIIPVFTGWAPPFYVSFFPDLGTSFGSIVKTFVFHPLKWLKLLASRSRWTYYAQVFYPVALVPLLSPLVLLIAVPQLMTNTLSGIGYTRDIHFYYTSIVIAGVFLATVEACARRGRTAAGRRFMVGLVAASALASNVAWGPSPISVGFHSGIWAQPGPKDQAINHAIAEVPPSASVSATYNIDDHMDHRVLIYEYPNPWVVTNWFVAIAKPPDPATVDWLVLDTGVTGNQTVLYETLVLSGEFSIVSNQDGILVLHRVRPGIHNDHKWP